MLNIIQIDKYVYDYNMDRKILTSIKSKCQKDTG